MNLRPVPPFGRWLPILALVTLHRPALGQVGDRGFLIVRSAGREVGLESFQVTPTANGYRVVTKGSFAMPRPGVEFSASLDRNGENDAAIQLGRVADKTSAETYGVLKRSRLTIRTVERGAEQASEFPGGAGTVLLADSLFALYLQLVPLATEEGRSLTAVLPQTPRRFSFVAQRVANSQPGGTLIRLSGGIEGEMELGRRGELLRVSIPSLGLEATRKPD